MKEQKPKSDEGEDETFDMYRFFSRLDVLAIALLILGLILYNLYIWLLAPIPPA